MDNLGWSSQNHEIDYVRIPANNNAGITHTLVPIDLILEAWSFFGLTFERILLRYLKLLGYEVKYVRNFTHVDDK
ncbi:hypothetical protein R6Q59_007447, partial [Mikania micrantha]